MVSKFHPLHRAYAAYGMHPPGSLLNDNLPDSDSKQEQDPQSDYQLSILNVPKEHATPEVRRAISMMFHKLEEMKDGIDKAKKHIHKLETKVDTDHTTGLPNRRAFFTKLEWSISMFERYKHHFSVIYFDMDDLTKINDTLGQTAGDMAIRHVGAIINDIRRDTDFLARIGSDEFALIMHYADEKASKKRAEDIAHHIARSAFIYNGKQNVVTTAFGVYEAQSHNSADMIVQRASLAMRQGKTGSKGHRRTEVLA